MHATVLFMLLLCPYTCTCINITCFSHFCRILNVMGRKNTNHSMITPFTTCFTLYVHVLECILSVDIFLSFLKTVMFIIVILTRVFPSAWVGGKYTCIHTMQTKLLSAHPTPPHPNSPGSLESTYLNVSN